MKEQKNIWRGMFYGFIAVACFSLTTPFTKIALQGFSPYFATAGRTALAGIIAAIIIYVRKESVPQRIYWRQLLIVALGVAIGFPLCSSLALQHTDVSHAGIVLAILPLLTSVIGAWINHEKHSAKFWMMAVSGSLTVMIYIFWKNGITLTIADFWLLAASLSVAISYAVGAGLAKHIGGMNTICWALVFILPLSVPIALYLLCYVESIANVSTASFAAFLYLAIVSQLLAFVPWYAGLSIGGIARVSQVQLL